MYLNAIFKDLSRGKAVVIFREGVMHREESWNLAVETGKPPVESLFLDFSTDGGARGVNQPTAPPLVEEGEIDQVKQHLMCC